MDDKFWERIERKRGRTAYFATLERQAVESQREYQRSPRRVATVRPKRDRRTMTPEQMAEYAAREKARLAAAEQRKAQAQARAAEQERKRDEREIRRVLREHQMVDSPKAAQDRAELRRQASEFRTSRRLVLRALRLRKARTRRDACLSCERRFRGRDEKIAENPGTVRYHGFGLCMSCAAGKVAGGNKTVHDGSTYCHACDVPLRGSSAPATDWPGTRRVVTRTPDGNFLCSTCYDRKRNGRSRQRRRPDNCVECHVSMYSNGQTPQPGQRHYAARGFCSTCMARQYRKKHSKPKPVLGSCTECDVKLSTATRNVPVPEGHRRHGGRGKCDRCYSRLAKRRDTM